MISHSAHIWQVIEIDVLIDIVLNSLFQSLRTAVAQSQRRSDSDLPVGECSLGYSERFLKKKNIKKDG